MSNSWFRLYAEFATDPKVQMLSEADQRRFIMILCMRCSNGDVTSRDDACDGGVTSHVTFSDSEVAFQMRISEDEWARTKAVLIAKNMIDCDNNPVNWDKRQYTSDSSRDRTRRYRQRIKSGVTPRDDAIEKHVTSQRRHGDALDTDTDTDTDTDPPTVGEGARVRATPAAPPAAERGDLKKSMDDPLDGGGVAPGKHTEFLGETNLKSLLANEKLPLGEAWEVPDDWGLYAEKLGIPHEKILVEIEKFTAFFTVGKAAGIPKTPRGWRQSWNVWVGKVADWSAKKTGESA